MVFYIKYYNSMGKKERNIFLNLKSLWLLQQPLPLMHKPHPSILVMFGGVILIFFNFTLYPNEDNFITHSTVKSVVNTKLQSERRSV